MDYFVQIQKWWGNGTIHIRTLDYYLSIDNVRTVSNNYYELVEGTNNKRRRSIKNGYYPLDPLLWSHILILCVFYYFCSL